MKIQLQFENNTLPDIYSKYTSEPVKGFSAISFPFTVADFPKEIVSLAWTFTDPDAIPVCGFEYIHWVVANLAVNTDKVDISEDFARWDQQHVKGSNSLTSKFLSGDFGDLSRSYIGPCPPDKDHLYNLKVFALDKSLNLSEGFYLNDLHHAMKGHILAQTSLELVGRA